MDETLEYLRASPEYRTSSDHLLAHVPKLSGDFYDFDTQVLSPPSVGIVADRYLGSLNAFRAQYDVDYLAFLDKDRGMTTGAILLAGLLCEKSGLPYVIAYADKEIELARVKCPGFGGKPANLEGLLGVLVTDHVSGGREVVRACEALRARGGQVGLVIAYSAFMDRLEKEHGPYFREHGIQFDPLTDVSAGQSERAAKQ